jgi:uncharacterized radical SAM superfamily Fe-S cluster-containing enzyme
MAMVEVTNRCDMACNICFADANSSAQDVPMPVIARNVDRLVEIIETPIPIQISGGEPTLRDDLPEIVDLIRARGFGLIELVTNGIAVSRRPELLEELVSHGLTSIYLQFDGLKPETHLQLRGQDMREVREGAVEAARRLDLCCILAVTVARGVNDDEIGDVLRYGIANIDAVRGINFQAAARFNGRYRLDDRRAGYDMGELLRLIEDQTGLAPETFRSEHLGRPECNAMSLVFVVDGKLEPLFKYISREDMLDFLGDNARQVVIDMANGTPEFFARHLTNPRAWKFIAKAAPIFGHKPFNVLRSKHLLLWAKAFMERPALDSARVDDCCYAMVDAEGVFSFCAYNNLYRVPERLGEGKREEA